MNFPVTENIAKSQRHTSFYLACGMSEATPIIFLHGWPELSISWRHQLPTFASLGFRALAPDMRGYGRSSIYSRHEDYALEQVVADMIELLDAIGAERAVWVGHDWGKGKPARTSFVRANGGWFGPQNTAPDVPRDATVLSEMDEHQYVAALEPNGFFGPDSWYMNADANAAFAKHAETSWRLTMPVLFMHGAYDYVCETIDSRLAEPMRANCANLTEVTILSGHWMAQEKPIYVNAALAKWLALQLRARWAVS